MKKRILAIVVVCCLMIGSAAAGWFEQLWEERLSHNSMIIEDTEVEFENEILNIDGKTYAPVRELMEKLFIPLEWHDEIKMVELKPQDQKPLLIRDCELDGGAIIPDEETARQYGKMILERHTGTKMEYENSEAKYYLTAYYYPDINLWSVSQDVIFYGGGGTGGSAVTTPTVRFYKHTGEVISIYTKCDKWVNPPLEKKSNLGT